MFLVYDSGIISNDHWKLAVAFVSHKGILEKQYLPERQKNVVRLLWD